MANKIKKNNWVNKLVFCSFLVIMLVINFIGGSLGITHFYWHLFLHIGIIVFSFLILIYSLKLNDLAMKYIMVGSMMWIIVNCILFLGHIFEEYYWLETNLFTFLGMIIGSLILMVGFKGAVK